MELHGVADGPGETDKNRQRNDEKNVAKSLELGRIQSKINPEQKKRKNGSQSGIYQEAKDAKESVQDEIPRAGIVSKAKRSPEKSDRQYRGNRGTRDHFKGYEHPTGENRPNPGGRHG